MKLPFLWLTSGFLTGAILDQSGLLNIMPYKVGLFSTALIPILWSLRGQRFFHILIFFTAILIGFVTSHYARLEPQGHISKYLSHPKISLEGVVDSDPTLKVQGKKETLSFVLRAENIMRWIPQERRREYFDVTGKVQVFSFQPNIILRYGDRVRLRGILELPKKVMNPGGFDYKAFLKQKQICCLFKTFGKDSLRQIESDVYGIIPSFLHKVRMRIEKRMDAFFEPSVRGVFKAILIGRRQDIPPEYRNWFMKTGTSHLLAISGLHVALMSGSFYLFLIMMRVRQKLASGLTILVILTQVFVTGVGIPVVRAGCMAAISFLAILFDRERHSMNTLLLVVFAFIVVDPLVIQNLSFQLSFISVFALILFIKNFQEKWKWSECFMMTVIVLVGTFPIIAESFNIISFTSIIANVLAIPLFHVALLAGAIAVLVGSLPIIGSSIIMIAHRILQLALAWIEWLSSFDYGYLYLESPSIKMLIVYYLLLGILITVWKQSKPIFKYLKPILLSTWLIFVLSMFVPSKSQAASITLLHAGRNELAHLQFKDQSDWIVNTGRRRPSNQSRWILEPYLRSRGINDLQAVILMDYYQKHVGGLESLTHNFFPQYLIFPKSGKFLIEKKKDIPKKSNILHVSKTREIQVSDREQLRFNSVNEKMMIQASIGEFQALFLPTLSPEVFEMLKQNRDEVLKTDLLILPSLNQRHMRWIENLMDYVDPALVTHPYLNKELDQFFKQWEIPFMTMEQYGALSIRSELNANIRIHSFLQGEVYRGELQDLNL